ncbi:RNA polymerase sigma factor, partial [Phaeovulum sp.]|uniref:RNA polymerase sigma factor n=1 Tax=Phaeovulum sp. TaxID=2934796 RepID=UPI003565FC2E
MAQSQCSANTIGGQAVRHKAQPDRSEEAAQVRALAKGDRAAFERVYRQHNAAMVRFADSILRSRASAEEVTQDAWV